jgi:predicted transcriptional regulator of viral defense system
MKFRDLLHLVADFPFFELSLVSQMAGEDRQKLLLQLHQWAKKGWIIPLKRGMYALGEPYQKAQLSKLALANALCSPSYLSCQWALSYYSVIPEMTVTYTSVTTRMTKKYENVLGSFHYSHLKKDFYWGYEVKKIEGVSVRIAEPEKALLDYFHLFSGEWTEDRLLETRIETDTLDMNKLKKYVERWNSPRLIRAVNRLMDFGKTKGTKL